MKVQASFTTSPRRLSPLNAAAAMAIAAFTICQTAQAKPVIADIAMLEAAGAELLTSDRELGLGYADLTPEQELRISEIAHAQRKCGGFEALPFGPVDPAHPLINNVFGEIRAQNERNRRFRPTSRFFEEVTLKPEITAALAQVNPANLKATVEFLSSFPDREHRSEDPNKHIGPMKAKLEEMIRASSLPATVDVIKHSSTEQQSIRVHIEGSARPNEVIVLGGHLDSINQSFGGAPGADDNASGSADVVEALRILLAQNQPERSVEFFFYAGEEGGLLGSAEIARTYKSQGKDVIAVLQLDMTLFPGAGPQIIGSMTDFTSAWLRSYLETINGLYIKAQIVNDRCGYGCSDHASWYRQGYPTLMPFESTFRGRNRNIHSSRDVVDSSSNFEHASLYAKIGIVMAMDLGNSTMREPR